MWLREKVQTMSWQSALDTRRHFTVKQFAGTMHVQMFFRQLRIIEMATDRN